MAQQTDLLDGVVASGLIAVVREAGRKRLPAFGLGGARRVAAYPADRPPADARNSGPRTRTAIVAFFVDAAEVVAAVLCLVI